MRVHPHLQHPQPAGPVVLPDRLVPLHVPVASEDVIDEDVQPAPVMLDVRDQLRDRCGILMVHDARRASPSGARDQLAGLLDRLGPADFRRPATPAAAAGRVDEEARAGKLDRDRPTGAASRAGDERHPRCLRHTIPRSTPERNSIAWAS